jgi:hypothetical protein
MVSFGKDWGKSTPTLTKHQIRLTIIFWYLKLEYYKHVPIRRWTSIQHWMGKGKRRPIFFLFPPYINVFLKDVPDKITLYPITNGKECIIHMTTHYWMKPPNHISWCFMAFSYILDSLLHILCQWVVETIVGRFSLFVRTN